MDILRITTISFLTALALAGCAQEEDQSDATGGSNFPPGALAITAPADVQKEATGMMTVVALGQASARGGDGSYTYSNDAPANGFPLGAMMVNWTVNDGAGAQANDMQSVTVTDSTPPIITAPPDIQTISTGTRTIVNIGTATITDLVDPNPLLSNDSPANGFLLGVTAVTWTGTDATGNVSTAVQNITVSVPTPGPLTLTPPGAITMEATGPSTAVILGAATVSGGTPPMTITNNAPLGGFTVGPTTVNWTVVDAAMVSATGTQAVTITDTTSPTITAPVDVTADQGVGLGDTSITLGTPTFNDLADPSPLVSNNAPANGFPVGDTTVIWTATDASGNSAIDIQLVTINPFVAQMCSTMFTDFVNEIYPLMNSANPLRCAGCHTGQNPSANTQYGWGFPNNPPTAADFDLFRTIASFDSGGQSLVLVKATGGLGHSGGDLFPNRLDENDPDYPDSDYGKFADFVNRAAVCQPDPPTNTATIDLGTGYEQLHKIAATLGARTPTIAETSTINAANNDQQAIDAALGPIVDGLMTEDAFYTRVQELYNDLLLTDRDADSRGVVDNNFDLDAFANRDYYENNFSGTERNDLRENANYGFARAPVELIRYVIQNNRPFTEIVSADYTMINPYSAVIYNNNAGDPNFLFSSDQNQANHDRDDFRPVNNIRQQDNTLVPAAGVIGTHAFLARYPSTNTNVNRARARYVTDFFLGLDIESLAARDGLDLNNVIGSVPTFEDPQCTVCHNVMDPIAGLFTNRDNAGEYDNNNTFQHTRTTNGVPRMVPAGYTLNQADELPSAEEDTALQWLGGRLAQDDRFAERTVRTVFKGLTGIDATAASTTAFLNDTKNQFVAANFNFKLLVKDIILSDYFRARNLALGENPSTYADIGAGRLITPEEINRKITDITGVNYVWRGPNSNSGLLGRHRLLYGGIDSDEVTKRITEPTSLIDGIQERISNQVACQRVAEDLYNNGTLFPFADETDIPDGGAGEIAIRQNIQFLHRHILGEDLAVTDVEIANTYQLFVDVRARGEAAIQSQCRGGGGSTDSNGTVIPWMAVVTYLLADYQFLYE